MKLWPTYQKLVILLVLVLSISSAAPAFAAGPTTNYSFMLDGKPLIFPTPPRLINGTMMVPYRAIAEAMGAKVFWNESQHSITAIKADVTLVLKINDVIAKRNKANIHLAAAPIIVNGTTLIPLRFFSEAFGSIVKWNGITKKITIENEAALLPIVGSYQNLQDIITKYAPESALLNPIYSRAETAEKVMAMPLPAPEASTAGASTDYSSTNVQVKGVDEADIVKTDGQYIYQVNKQRIIVAKALPAEQLSISSTLSFSDQTFSPTELYIDNNYLIVIGTSYTNLQTAAAPAEPDAKRFMPIQNQSSVKAIQYDLRDKTKLVKIREIELEGSYVTSRKIGSNLYFIANQYVNYYTIMNEKTEIPTPLFRDTAVSDKSVSIGYDHIRYFPQSLQPNYLLIAGVDLDKPEEKANVQAYLGSSQNVFASQKNLYITLTQYNYPTQPIAQENSTTSSIALPAQPTTTLVYKFMFDQANVRFTGSGEIPGIVLNQYAMDEYGGYFRIATTSGEAWRNDELASKNNVYILNESLETTGKLENLAPGERIYSTRFLGNRAYIVTFRQVDPLFVIDLTHPQAPKVLGSLKIPGYSDYLHPYDENHIIGFGKDTVEVSNDGGLSGTKSTTAYYQGMKIALFDVTDVTHPIEMFKESIGDRGTDSELLHNPKALLFNKDKGLLAFPVTLMTIASNGKDQPTLNPSPEYGQFAYQGAYIYHLDLTSGFKLTGTITHLDQQDLAQAGGNWYYSDKSINRILHIDNTLYTVSNSEIKASSLNSLQQIDTLLIP